MADDALMVQPPHEKENPMGKRLGPGAKGTISTKDQAKKNEKPSTPPTPTATTPSGSQGTKEGSDG